MNQKCNISIKKPCSEKFNNFQMTKKGGYCTSCQKEVIDFTNMTQQEIQNYFKVTKTNICGYFLESQLKTNYNTNLNKDNKINPFATPLIGATLLSFFAINSSFAQKKSDSIEINPTLKNHIDTENKDSISNKNPKIISGIVLDKNQIPISGAIITLKGKKVNVSSDFEGKFRFPKYLKKGDNLLVSYIGFETQEVKIINNHLKIVLKESQCNVLGEVSINQTYKSKISFFDKLKNWFK